ncbi:MAG: hypothetical protein JJ863_18945 [Deltaproteobacteria bacterium]|nr:hypothetical protein [Deltaproteobacteria bacterium]
MRAVPLAALALFACSDGTAARALEAAAPFRQEHERFAAWAERTLDSEAGHPRTRPELEETLFAPLILESEVLGAEVRRGESVYAHGDAIPADLEWSQAREGTLDLEVAELRLGTTPAIAIATVRDPYRIITVYRRAE